MLFFVAVIPVIVLCFFIYIKDSHKEPSSLLLKLFFGGFFVTIPILIAELFLSIFFSPDKVSSFILIFIFSFISIAIVEEGFKWLVVKWLGFKNKEFDEIYDIIVYSVFVSLGFACIENILYVYQNGLSTGYMRAVLSVPGHTCFGVFMGYYFAKAKVFFINNNMGLYKKNITLSLIVPALFHTMYDSLLFYYSSCGNSLIQYIFFIVFIIYHIVSVIICIVIVCKTSKVQKVLKTSINDGLIKNDNSGHVVVNYSGEIHFCPVCGSSADLANYCGKCGCKLR